MDKSRTLDLSNVDCDVNYTLGEEEESLLISKPLNTIPSLKLFDVSLKGVASKVSQLKLDNKAIEYLNKIQNILALFDKYENHYSETIILFAMQAIENYFIGKRKQGEFKESLVVRATKKYFNNDEELVKKFIQLMHPNLKNSRLYKLKVYFLKKVGMLL